jgi:hypothetical protein
MHCEGQAFSEAAFAHDVGDQQFLDVRRGVSLGAIRTLPARRPWRPQRSIATLRWFNLRLLHE